MAEFRLTEEIAPDTFRHITANEEIVSTRLDALRRGVSKGGKPYAYIEKGERITVSRRSGQPRIYGQRNFGTTRSPRYSGIVDRTYSCFDLGDTQPIHSFLRDWYPNWRAVPPVEYGKATGTSWRVTNLQRIIWPMSFPVTIETEWTPIAGMNSALRKESVSGFTREFFGPASFRKDLVKAVAQSDIYTVNLAKVFATRLPVDYAIGFMNNARAAAAPASSTRFSARELTKIVQNMHETTARNLTLNFAPTPLNNISGIIQDTILDFQNLGGYQGLSEMRFKTWSDLHAWSSLQVRKMRHQSVPIRWRSKKANSLHGKQSGSVTIIAPDETGTMLDWGEYMSNCIGSYKLEALRGDSYFYAAIKDGQMFANIQLDKSGNVMQLLGRFNKKLDQSEKGPIKGMIQTAFPGANTSGGWQ